MKENDTPSEIVVDARGHRCPVPTLRLRRAIEAAPPGAVLRLIADDPLARVDAPHLAGQLGLEVLSADQSGSLVTVIVRKPAA